MEVSGGKKSTRTCLDISPLFFHTFPRVVQGLVITYDEIFQALAVEGDVLLPKPFLDLGFDSAIGPNLAPSSFNIFGKLK
jgi:hypothetical protein